MNDYINYFVEANIGLVFTLGIYWLALRRENHFSFQRMYLLAGILLSVLFPLFHVGTTTSNTVIPTLHTIVPTYWLPEVVINDGAHNTLTPPQTVVSFWTYVSAIYLIVALLLLVRFAFNLISVFRVFSHAKWYSWKGCHITESTVDRSTFSFFHFIVIANAHELTASDRDKIVNHEYIHARRLHSLDIILVNLLIIIFWINPLIRIYRNILVQLHEFEADAYATSPDEVDTYCSLLARVALQSIDYPVANHFNNSLTTKRIAMMRTIKTKIQRWKVMLLALAAPLLFLVIACQEQVSADIQSISNNAALSVQYPAEVKARVEQLQKENPGNEYVVIEMNDEGKQTLNRLQVKYGKKISFMEEVRATPQSADAGRNFVILAKNNQSQVLGDMTASQDKVFIVVEQMPEFPGGIPALMEFLNSNIKYPESARKAGIQGTSFIEFIVNQEGKLSDFKVVKSLSAECDREAIRALSLSPAWQPAKQNGETVKVKLVMPVKYSIDYHDNKNNVAPEGNNGLLQVKSQKKLTNGKTVLTGTVRDQAGKPVAGANLVLQNSTRGTTTAADGSFQFETSNPTGSLVVSYIGYKSTEIAF